MSTDITPSDTEEVVSATSNSTPHTRRSAGGSDFSNSLATLGAVSFGVYLHFIRPWQLRWGAL